jgi:hypothetical protein
VISRQTTILKKDGLIKRTKGRPKSRLLTISLTEKSIELLKVAKHSDGMREVLTVLTREKRQQLDLILNRPGLSRRRQVWGMLTVLGYSRHSFLWPLFNQQLSDVRF